jgi:hypothetical protein
MSVGNNQLANFTVKDQYGNPLQILWTNTNEKSYVFGNN